MKTPNQLGATVKAAMLALAGSAVLAVTASAQVTFSPGDLLMSFKASSGTGQETNVIYNLGSAAGYRDNPDVGGAIAGLGDILSSTYGANWFTRTDLSWGLVAAHSNLLPVFPANGPTLNGDPSASIYVSREAFDFGVSIAPSQNGTGNNFTSNNVRLGATDIVGFWNTVFSGKEAAPGTDNLGVLVASAHGNSFTAYTDPALDFGLITGGITGAFGTGEDFAYLDLYRILSDAGVAGITNPDGYATGEAHYVTTFTIDAAGNIYAGTGAIPEPSAFAALAGGVALLAVAGRRRRRNA